MKCSTNARRLLSSAALSIAIVSGTPGAAAGENTFSGSGPFGGRAMKVEFDPNDANRVYARSLGNGLFFSDDGGTTWARFNVDHPSINLGSISDFDLDPNNPSTLWVVDSGSEVVRSTDRGVTWTASTAGLPGGIENLAVDQTDSGTVFAFNSSSLYRSTDNGDTWTNVSAGLTTTPIKSLMQSPSDPDVFMALSWDGPYKSTDGGQTWAAAAATLPLTNNGYVFANYGVFDPNNSDIALINVSNQQNWRTLDGGATWAPYGSNVPNDFFTEMVRDPANPNRIFLGTGNNDVFVSNDNGLSWGAADVSGLDQYSVYDIAFDPATPSRMLIGTFTKGVLESLDSGANWTLSTQGFVGIGVESIGFSKTDDRIYAGVSGGTATSTDDGLTWEANIGSYDLQTFAIHADPLLAGHAYAGSSCCGLYETFNGGQTWDRIDLEIPSVVATWVTDIDVPQNNPLQLTFTDFNRGLFATQDGGATWAQLSGSLQPFFNNNVVLEGVDASESNSDILYVASSDFQSGGVFSSDDFGTTWTRLSGSGLAGPSRAFDVAVHPLNPNIVFAGGTTLYRSVDGGENWTLPASPVSGTVLTVEIDHDNPQLMYALSELSGLFRSVDGGNTWSSAPTDNTTARTNHMTVDPDDRGRVLIGYDNIGYQEITFSTDVQMQNNSGAVQGNTGELLGLSLTVTSAGPITANAVEVEAIIPPELSISSAVASSGACAIDNQTVICSLGTLAIAATSSVDLELTPLADGEYIVSATATSLESDPDAANNVIAASITVGDLLDSDGDGVADSADNCTTRANSDQTDTDGDGYGNACDADFNNDCVVNFLDIAAFSGEFLGANALFDINTDGAVNFLDFVVVSQAFLQQPGPGLGSCE